MSGVTLAPRASLWVWVCPPCIDTPNCLDLPAERDGRWRGPRVSLSSVGGVSGTPGREGPTSVGPTLPGGSRGSPRPVRVVTRRVDDGVLVKSTVCEDPTPAPPVVRAPQRSPPCTHRVCVCSVRCSGPGGSPWTPDECTSGKKSLFTETVPGVPPSVPDWGPVILPNLGVGPQRSRPHSAAGSPGLRVSDLRSDPGE